VSASKCLPNHHRLIRIVPSIAHQIQGLIFALGGPHIEADPCALTAEDALTSQWGLQQYECLSSLFNIFLHDFNIIAQVIATAMYHNASGVFIIPDLFSRPELRLQFNSTIALSASSQRKHWFDYILELNMHKTPIRIPLHNAIRGLYSNVPAVAVVLSFGDSFKFTSKKKRKEKCLPIYPVPLPPKVNRKLTSPWLRHRISPLADELAASIADDIVPATPDHLLPIIGQPDHLPPLIQRPPKWNIQSITKDAITYPHPGVFDLTLKVMTGTLDPFKGDRSKAIISPPYKPNSPEELIMRNKMQKQVEEDLVWGPSKTLPFANTRTHPHGAAVKHRHLLPDDPRRKEIRMTSNLSIHEPHSVNDLEWNPKWLTIYWSVDLLCNMLILAGPGTKVSLRDIPKAFRMNPNNDELFFLHVAMFETKEFGVEYFVELYNEFGWRPSEWGWQGALAIVLWLAEYNNVPYLRAFVDNFMRLHPPGANTVKDLAELAAFFKKYSIPTHEHTDAASKFQHLGWDWNIADIEDSMTITCPIIKQTYYLSIVQPIIETRASSITLPIIGTLSGAFGWLSTACPIGKAYLPPLFEMRTKAEAIHDRIHGHPKNIRVKITTDGFEALSFWATWLASWEGSAPIMANFGAEFPPQRLGFCDASGWGSGGIYWDKSSKSLRGFSHQWTTQERDSLQLSSAINCEAINSPAAEMEALCIWMHHYASACSKCRVLLHTDAKSTVQALKKAYSDSHSLRTRIRSFRITAAKAFINVRVTHISGKRFNQIADLLSRNETERAKCLARSMFGVELCLEQ
jgi:hypothetical protein